MNPYEFTLAANGIQRASFIMPFLGAVGTGITSLASGAVSLAAPAVGALGSAAGFLGETAIGAGGTILGGIGSLGTGIIDTAAGTVKGAGTVLFGGGTASPGLTVGETMAAMAEPGYYGPDAAVKGGGVFGSLSLDTLANVAGVGYNVWQSSEQMKLAEKAIEAQRKAGYVVGAPGTTALSPTTSIAMPAAGAPGRPPGLFQTEQGAKMIKYAIIIAVGYLLFKGVM